MPSGYLKVQLSSVRQVVPIEGASIRIYKEKQHELVHESFHVSDVLGSTPYIALEAPPAYHAACKESEVCPYATYHVEIRHQDYESMEVVNVQIFAQQYTTLPLVLKPILESSVQARTLYFVVEHMLYKPPKKRNRMYYPPFYERSVQIPNQLCVHIGKPSKYGDNMYVDFIYYIKNVACSELYPTWEKEAIKAGVYQIISFTIQRLQTKWYKSKGYAFSISSDPMYDQCFVYHRNIFDRIGEIVDEVFNEYMQTHPSDAYSKQQESIWMYQDLALQGKQAMEILQLQNKEVSIISNNALQGVTQTYPGVVLREGSKGKDVMQIQSCLQAITFLYPSFGPLCADGKFGPSTLACVLAFQQHYSLCVDGQVGKQTWYKIMYLYAMVRFIKNLQSLREEKAYPFLQPTIEEDGLHDVEAIMCVQYMINVLAFYDRSQPCFLSIDGVYGPRTKECIRVYQKQNNLKTHGNVDAQTYASLVEKSNLYWCRMEGKQSIPNYPEDLSFSGMEMEHIAQIQKALTIVGSRYTYLTPLLENGKYDEDTKQNVLAFQKHMGLKEDGIVGKQTWETLFAYASYCKVGKESYLTPSHIRPLFCLGSKGEDVTALQEKLHALQLAYFPTSECVVDGMYGMQTRDCIVQLQEMLGLPEDGNVNHELYTLLEQMASQLTKEE